MDLELASGEMATVEIIRRSEAKAFLSKPAIKRTWFGDKFKSLHRHSRGPGGAADMINYGLVANGKCRAVMRLGSGPWGNAPVIAAVGAEQAKYAAYLMRLYGTGISTADLVNFIQITMRQRFANDMLLRRPDLPRFRYAVSLDELSGWLIDNPNGGFFEGYPAAGRIYHAGGALYGGQTQRRAQPTRYVDSDGRLRSIYNAGHNLSTELKKQPQTVQFVHSGPMHRFVFILAEPGTLEYVAYRAALPGWVREFEYGDHGLGWIQPRLLTRWLKGMWSCRVLPLAMEVATHEPA